MGSLWQWITDHPGLGLGALGVLLLAGEALGGELVLLMLGVGALAGGASTLLGLPLWGGLVVMAATSLAMLGLVRPRLLALLNAAPQEISTGPEALIGQTAEVIEAVGAGSGRVRMHGETWRARPAEGLTQTVAVGAIVEVESIEGATAIVVPRSLPGA